MGDKCHPPGSNGTVLGLCLENQEPIDMRGGCDVHKSISIVSRMSIGRQ